MARLRLVTLGIVRLARCRVRRPEGASLRPPPARRRRRPSQGAVATAAPTADACATETLATMTAGTLTDRHRQPGLPAVLRGREDGNTEPWDPELAVTRPPARASRAPWPTRSPSSSASPRDAGRPGSPSPFNNSFAPGPKDFDFFINQVSFNAERAENADLSEGYYFGNQTVVAMTRQRVRRTRPRIAELKAAELGAQVGTTSLATIEDVIQPTAEAARLQHDRRRDRGHAERPDRRHRRRPADRGLHHHRPGRGRKIVGQIGLDGRRRAEHFSLVLEKDSPLTDCVNQAIAALDDDGTLDALRDEWLPFDSAPELQP